MQRYKHSTDTLQASDEEHALMETYDEAWVSKSERFKPSTSGIRNQMLDKVGFDRGVEAEDGRRAIVSRGTRGLQA